MASQSICDCNTMLIEICHSNISIAYNLYNLLIPDASGEISVDLKFALPGKERQDSVFSGLQVLPNINCEAEHGISSLKFF